MTGRRAALNTLLNITDKGAYANLAVKKGLSGVSTNDVGRLTALIYTTVERLKYCDFIISAYAKGRLHSVVRGILRLGVAELLFMHTPAYAVCNESVTLAAEIGKPQLKGFVNGVLRSIARDAVSGGLPELPEPFTERMELLYGYPSFIIEEYKRRFGEAFTEELIAAHVETITLRAVYPFSKEALINELRGRGLECNSGEWVEDSVVVKGYNYDISDDELFAQGKATVQSQGAMLACLCLEPKSGMKILDCCAAPGGKTSYIYDLMKRKGVVTAWELHRHRAELVKNTLSRLGIHDIMVEVRDASVSDKRYNEAFDAVLCDVPCSGLGGGAKPDARYNKSNEDIASLSDLQYRILTACSAYVRVGGSLVYSTCTVSERENECVVDKFIKENVGFRTDSLSRFLPKEMSGRGALGNLQLYPNIDKTDGFYITRMVRIK